MLVWVFGYIKDRIIFSVLSSWLTLRLKDLEHPMPLQNLKPLSNFRHLGAYIYLIP